MMFCAENLFQNGLNKLINYSEIWIGKLLFPFNQPSLIFGSKSITVSEEDWTLFLNVIDLFFIHPGAFSIDKITVNRTNGEIAHVDLRAISDQPTLFAV